MENQKEIIYEFLNQFEDFTREDRESGYAKVYRPGWHPHPLQFWFNPPFGEDGKSTPTLSNAVILLSDGKIMVEDVYTGLSYDLDMCLGTSIQNFIQAITDNSH
jgi:hypothetical protein